VHPVIKYYSTGIDETTYQDKTETVKYFQISIKHQSVKRILFVLQMIFLVQSGGAQPLITVDQEKYLSKHDVVYLEPEMEGYNGFPLGNGDLGGMIWFHDQGLQLQINKIDLYDIPENDRMTLRAAAQVKIDFGVPCYNYLYVNGFEGRLSLHKAQLNVNSTTAFADTKIETFVDAGNNVWVIDCEADYSDILPGGARAEVQLGRWGSRTFRSWYSGVHEKPADGLGRASTKILDNDLIIEENFEGGLSFSVACRVIGSPMESEPISNRNLSFRTGLRQHHKFQILLAVVTSREAANTTIAAIELLNQAEKKGVTAIKKEHHQWWDNFWKQSFVHLSDDYIENIYYIRRYLMGSSSRGSYPVPFNGGLWVWNHDHRQWVTPHHWNTQSSYWGLAAQNDIALMRPYIDTYFRLMPAAEAYALSRGATDAILWNEAHDFNGNMVGAGWGNMVNNFTPASQIGMIFWDYYKFTGDLEVLRDTVYPFIRKAAGFYMHYLKWDSTRSEYFIFPSQPYEHAESSRLKNTSSDRYMIEFLLRSCIEAATTLEMDAEMVPKWQHVLEHLWDPPVLDVPGRGKVFGTAFQESGEVYPGLDIYEEYSKDMYHFDAHTTQVYPAGVLGLDQSGTEDFNIARNVALHQPEWRNAITPGSIVSARLGLGDNAMEKIRNAVNHMQHFTQGLFYNIDHWFMLSRYYKLSEDSLRKIQRDYVYDRRARYTSGFAGTSGLMAWPFIQCGMEPIGIIATTINEMLLQSHEDAIRVFPALPDTGAYAFRLRARGAFMVSSHRDSSGFVQGVQVESLQGNICRLQKPWKGKISVSTGSGTAVKFEQDKNNVVSFPTRKGEIYTILPLDSARPGTLHLTANPNMKPKFFGYATLGKEQTFRKFSPD
jgi:alpha-L-fucosidase 2